MASFISQDRVGAGRQKSVPVLYWAEGKANADTPVDTGTERSCIALIPLVPILQGPIMGDGESLV